MSLCAAVSVGVRARKCVYSYSDFSVSMFAFDLKHVNPILILNIARTRKNMLHSLNRRLTIHFVHVVMFIYVSICVYMR